MKLPVLEITRAWCDAYSVSISCCSCALIREARGNIAVLKHRHYTNRWYTWCFYVCNIFRCACVCVCYLYLLHMFIYLMEIYSKFTRNRWHRMNGNSIFSCQSVYADQYSLFLNLSLFLSPHIFFSLYITHSSHRVINNQFDLLLRMFV